MKTIATMAFCALLPLPALAQDEGWEYSASVYGFIPALGTKTETPYGELETNASSSDILDNLDMGLMAAVEARDDRWALLLDFIYAKLSVSKDTPFGALFSQADIRAKVTAVSGYALYRSYETDRLLVDVGGGMRAFWLDVDAELRAAEAPSDRSFGGTKSWAVPVVAGRFTVPFNDKWFATAMFDYGQTHSDVWTWQGILTVGYNINDRWAVRAGYRTLELKQELSGRDTELEFRGPIIGVTARF